MTVLAQSCKMDGRVLGGMQFGVRVQVLFGGAVWERCLGVLFGGSFLRAHFCEGAVTAFKGLFGDGAFEISDAIWGLCWFSCRGGWGQGAILRVYSRPGLHSNRSHAQ